jgi:hypothetical protein
MTINLCLNCRSINNLLMCFKYGFNDGSIRSYSKISDLDSALEEEKKIIITLRLNLIIYQLLKTI